MEGGHITKDDCKVYTYVPKRRERGTGREKSKALYFLMGCDQLSAHTAS